jgi:tetratricopeptide (TPR) repeat protein
LRRILLLISIVIFFIGCATTGKVKPEKEGEKTSQNVAEKTDTKKKKSILFPEIYFYHDKDLALREMEQDMEKEPDFLFKMANSYFDSGRYDEAEKIYAKIVKNYFQTYDVFSSLFNLGLISIKKQEWEQAAKYLKAALMIVKKPEDRKDTYFLLLDVLRQKQNWTEVLEKGDEMLNSSHLSSYLTESEKYEVALRKAEAFIKSGKFDEGKKLVNYVLFNIKRGKNRTDLLYDPEYARANFILGVLESEKFAKLELRNSEESLLKKCELIVEAQKYYVRSIRAGIVYWTNASIFETSKLYTTLYQEMVSFPIPEGFGDEEKEVYNCELWKKVSGLLSKSRRILKKSLKVAENTKEDNEYLSKSIQLLVEIENIYEMKEKSCEKFNLDRADISGGTNESNR